MPMGGEFSGEPVLSLQMYINHERNMEASSTTIGVLVSLLEDFISIIVLGTTQNFEFSFTFIFDNSRQIKRVNIPNGDRGSNKNLNKNTCSNPSPLCLKLKKVLPLVELSEYSVQLHMPK